VVVVVVITVTSFRLNIITYMNKLSKFSVLQGSVIEYFI
jgi:hypothetical protein